MAGAHHLSDQIVANSIIDFVERDDEQEFHTQGGIPLEASCHGLGGGR